MVRKEIEEARTVYSITLPDPETGITIYEIQKEQ